MLIKIKIIAKNRSKINQTSKYQHRNSTIIEMTVIVIRAVVSISSSVSVGFWLKTVVHGIGCARFRLFFIQKMSITLHITFTENNTLCRTIHQMDNIVMFVCKLAIYVMQLLHIKTQITFRVGLYSD